jgi:RNA polymerase sigma-70 factor, ECF subfamily
MVAVEVDLKPLVEQARAGQPDAWDQLFRRYQLPLYAFVYEWVREEQTSLDVVQETFINALRHLDSLRDDEKFGSWLFGIAHQKCLQAWRRRTRQPLFAEEDLAQDIRDDQDDPAACLVRREEEEEFLAALEQLAPAYRSVLVLHFLQDFPIEDIAGITGVPVGTVKSRLHYAKRHLRELLEKRT